MILCTQISALLWVNYLRKLLMKSVTHITESHKLSQYRNYQLSNFTATEFHTKIQNLMTQFTDSLGIMPDDFSRLYTPTRTLSMYTHWNTYCNTWNHPSGLLFVFLIKVGSNDFDFCFCQQQAVYNATNNDSCREFF
jgi:hypothetical protein